MSTALANDHRRDVPGAVRRVGAPTVFVVLLVPYVAGLAAWLAIGLVPTLAAHFETVRRAVAEVASSHGYLAAAAYRVLHRDVVVNAGGMVMGAAPVASATTVAVQYLFSALNVILGLVLALRLRRERSARLLAFGLFGTAATFNEPSHEVFHVIGSVPAITALHFLFHVVSGVTYLWAVVLFPDGTWPGPLARRSGRARSSVALGVTALVALVCWRSSFIHHPPFFVVFFGIVVPCLGIAALSVRLAERAGAEVVQQCRLLRAALVPALGTGLVWVVAFFVGHTLTPQAIGARALDVRLEAVFPAVFALVPVMLLVALSRYRLWDLDVILGKTLLYAGLAGTVSLAYVVTIALVGRAAGSAAVVLVVVMAAVGLALDPLRQMMQALLNRLIFGQRLSPAEAMRALASGLEQMGPDEELGELTRVAVEATRASSATLWLLLGERLVASARSGRPPAEKAEGLALGAQPSEAALCDALEPDRCYPIRYQGRLLGALALGLGPGVELGRDDERLVADLAGHAGLLVHNAHLAADLLARLDELARRTDELAATRRQVVESQDRERRRLERNLHDGAQQELVALLVGLRSLEAADPAADGSVAELVEMREMLRCGAADLERLCGGGLPAALEQLGLAGALGEAGATLRRSGLDVALESAQLAEVPPEVAATVYFSVLEAMQNVAKHAQARRCVVSLSSEQAGVAFVVVDDGRGFRPGALSSGAGLRNLVERVTAEGGALEVESAPGHGTVLRGWVPFVAAARSAASEGAGGLLVGARPAS